MIIDLEFYWNGSTIAYNGYEEYLNNILLLLHNEDFMRILKIIAKLHEIQQWCGKYFL